MADWPEKTKLQEIPSECTRNSTMFNDEDTKMTNQDKARRIAPDAYFYL